MRRPFVSAAWNTMKLAVMAASLLLTGTASAASIGLNYVNIGEGGVQNGPSDALGAAELAGAPGYQQANWNNLGRWGQTVAVNDSSGAASGVTTTWDSNNTWNTGAGSSTPDHKLMHGYLDATGQVNWWVDNSSSFWWNENKPEALVKGLSAWLSAQGAPRYQVVVYIDGDTTEGRVGEYWLQAPGDAMDPPQTLGADLSSHVFARDSANFSGAYTHVPLSANSVANAGDGNYVVFGGLTADSFILRTEEHTFRAQINGMQIIAVPEPATIFLLAGCSLVLVASWRRRLT